MIARLLAAMRLAKPYQFACSSCPQRAEALSMDGARLHARLHNVATGHGSGWIHTRKRQGWHG